MAGNSESGIAEKGSLARYISWAQRVHHIDPSSLQNSELERRGPSILQKRLVELREATLASYFGSPVQQAQSCVWRCCGLGEAD